MKVQYLASASLDGIYQWARQLVDTLNRTPDIADLPTFADNAAAGAGNVPIGDGYVTPTGSVKRRVA